MNVNILAYKELTFLLIYSKSAVKVELCVKDCFYFMWGFLVCHMLQKHEASMLILSNNTVLISGESFV